MKPFFRGDTWVIDVCTLQLDGECDQISEATLSAATVRATVAGYVASVAKDPEIGVRLRLQVDPAITAQATPSTTPYPCDVEITFDDGRVSTFQFSIIVRADVSI